MAILKKVNLKESVPKKKRTLTFPQNSKIILKKTNARKANWKRKAYKAAQKSLSLAKSMLSR
jgi:hypothetical protein